MASPLQGVFIESPLYTEFAVEVALKELAVKQVLKKFHKGKVVVENAAVQEVRIESPTHVRRGKRSPIQGSCSKRVPTQQVAVQVPRREVA
jgi:hypothetical protein